MAEGAAPRVTLGRISGLYGVRGWVKIYSYTSPREQILSYSPWLLQRAGGCTAMKVVEGHRHGKGVVARLEGCDDREQARALIGAEIRVGRERLGEPEAGRYYWSDLVGLEVIGRGGARLGVVDHLMETGAHDVLVVRGERERLIPFVPGTYVSAVERERGRIVVDWDPEWES